MPQVVTNDNIMELHTTGKVAEFVAPKAEEAKPAEGTTEQPRGGDGKFQSPTGEKSPKEDEAAKAADDDDETDHLTESVRRKIGKQVRRRKEAEEFARERDADAERERARADALQRRLDEAQGTKSSTGQPAADSGDDDPEPKAEDFKTAGELIKAQVKWEARQAARNAQKDTARSQQQQTRQATVNAFVASQEKFEADHPDYKEVLETVEDDRIPPVTLNYFVENPEVGPALAYYLAKNPDELTRLRKLSPARVIAELGKLEAKAVAPAAQPNKGEQPTPIRQSRAPAPVQPIDGSSAPAVQKDPSKMNVQELRAYRIAERKSRAG